MVLSRTSGPDAATRDIVYTTAITLLTGAVLCAVTGAVSHTRQQRGSSRA